MAKVPLRNYNREIETMIDRGQLDEAIAHSQHILKTFPKHLETYRLLGKAYLEYKRRTEAADIFLRVLAAEPNDFVANVGMSILRDEENKLDDAIWHMERAFEVQPSNPAIQAELQRLYGRRDGVTPPRIRMTRGALAHMYVQGELYPQAISEIKSVLKEDHGRSDMQALLARAYYKSGQKNDAAEAANSVLRRYPYCLDANRVLAEILGADRPENAQVYRQRVVELDPYAAQVTGTIFQANEVSDNAVSLEALDWNGQPANTQADWSEPQASATNEGGEPDWLRSGFTESTPPPPAKPTVVPPVQASPAAFASPASSEPAAVPTPAEDIPEFLRAAGWGKSTGAFDESKASFAEELEASASAASAEPIEQADLPDWVKEMMPQDVSPAPVEPAQPAAEEEELPDWIKNIGPGAVAGAAAVGASAADLDWLQDTEESASATSVPGSDDTLNWMKGLDRSTETTTPASSDDSLDWLTNLDQPAGEATPAATEAQSDWMSPASESADSLDWLKNLDQPVAESAAPAESSQPDWMNSIEQPAATSSESADDSLDWLKGLDHPAAETPVASETQPDWMSAARMDEPAQASSVDQPDWLQNIEQPAAPSSESSDESRDWLKGFDQPAAEEPVAAASQPELKNEFDWLDEVGNEPQPTAAGNQAMATNDFDFFEEEPTEKPTEPRMAPIPPVPPLDAGALGTSQKEIDDSLAWLENLAAKQGATEGLLTKPEERLQDEPEWVRKIKGSTPPPSAPEPVAAEPTPVQPESVPQTPVESMLATTVEDLGKSQQEIDDSLAWLENLAAKQGATEGLLTKPEERLQDEPEWVKQSKSAPVPREPVEQTPPPVSQPEPVAKVEDLGKSQQEIDDSLAWLENLAAKQGATEGLLTKPEERLQDEPEWVKQAKSAPVPQEPVAQTPPPVAQPEPVAKVEDLGKSQQEIDDSLAWLENLAAKQGATEGLLTKPEERLQDEPEWVKQAKAAPVPQEPALAAQPSVEDEAVEEEPQFDLEAQLPEAVSPAAEPVTEETGTATWFDRLEDEAAEPAASEPVPSDEMPEWLRNLEVEDTKPSPAPTSADTTAMWFKDLAEPERPASDAEAAPVAESIVPAEVPGGDFAWLDEVESGESASPVTPADDNLPSWLRGVDDETRLPQTDSLRGLPGWMQDETGEVLAEPTRIEPTRPDDWQPEDVPPREAPSVQPPVQPEPMPEPIAQKPVEEPKPKPVRKPKPAEPKREPYREPVTLRGTGMLTMPVDPILGSARTELSRSNIPGALESYGKLIKKGRFLDEVIFDLREALDRYPVEVSILQALGDAYMRANRLQDALDAYTKAEELLR